MTEATTADKLAAWQLIEEHGLYMARVQGEFRCCDQNFTGRGDTLAAAVKSWAAVAGVPWNPPKVVPMWAVARQDGVVLQASRAETVLPDEWKVVPCEVVIRETEGV